MPKKSGFTLIELMVVIAIIGILSIIGISTYSSVQKAARDSKRRQDIDEIAKALETNKSSNYIAITTGQFANNSFPKDPLAPSHCDGSVRKCGSGTNPTATCMYCLRATVDGAGYCSEASPICINDQNNVGFGAAGTLLQSWYVCANLETGTTKYYCKKSQQ